MKKLLFVIVIAIVLVASVSALELNLNLGLVSGIGVSQDVGSWQFGADLETTFPVYCTINGIMAMKYEECSFWEGFKLGLTYFFGLDLYSYFKLLEDDGYSVYAGLDIMMGTETEIKSFETVLRPTLKFNYDLGTRCGIFLAAGFSLLDIMYVPGFEKPLVRVPDVNYASILTGCRVGLKITLV